MSDPKTILDAAFRGALQELLEFYAAPGSTVQGGPRTTPAAASFAASLGFTADHLRGTLVLIAPEVAIARVLPAELAGGRDNPDALADWAAELSNQLVGRVKNKLLRFGVTITLSVPSVFRAESLRCYPRKTSLPAGASTVQVSIGMADFDAWFDVEVQPGVVLEERASLSAPPSEGELVFL